MFIICCPLIVRFRSPTRNVEDHVALARLIPKDLSVVLNIRKRRDAYSAKLLDTIQQSIEKGVDGPCIVGNILKDPEERFTQDQLTTICLSMISGLVHFVQM
jgi:phenylacetate 2-hydroxylase